MAALILSLVCGLGGIWWRRAKTDRHVVNCLREFGANAYFEGGRVRGLEFLPTAERAGDEDIARLKHLKALETLDLTDTNVTDAGIRHLVGLPNLKYLFVDASRISDKGVRVLTSNHPHPSISFVDCRAGSERRILKTY